MEDESVAIAYGSGLSVLFCTLFNLSRINDGRMEYFIRINIGKGVDMCAANGKTYCFGA